MGVLSIATGIFIVQGFFNLYVEILLTLMPDEAAESWMVLGLFHFHPLKEMRVENEMTSAANFIIEQLLLFFKLPSIFFSVCYSGFGGLLYQGVFTFSKQYLSESTKIEIQQKN